MPEKEYIAREAVLKLLSDCGAIGEFGRYLIEKAPAADVTEIVRCRDCKLRKTEDCAMYCQCDCGQQHTWETDNDFCSFGKRKD